MVNVPVIAKRELSTYFLSLTAYLVLMLFALVNALVFALLVGGPEMDPNGAASSVFGFAMWFLIFAAAIMTMRLLSEETSSGTIESLMTTPVSDAEVVLGKYVGALLFGMVMLAPIILECAFLAMLGGMDYGPVASGLLGVYLLVAQFLAIGLFWSAMIRIQLVSALATIVTLFGALLLGQLAERGHSVLAKACVYAMPPSHLDGFMKGVIDSRDLVYFVATTALLLFLSVRALEARKWR